jgi:phosphatidylethanolamine/phosphatidyl-N-methylethanolamine N-methyltransferase
MSDNNQKKMPGQSPDPVATQATQRRYNRIAPVYDIMESIADRHTQRWMKNLWPLVEGPRLLEVGVGTGNNLASYPAGVQAAAIDLTSGMLARARRKALELRSQFDLIQMDAQIMGFADESFDTVVATCVFCSVPDPVLGLSEVLRVTKTGGRVLLIEHVRSEQALLGLLMDLVNPLVVRMMGPHINRRTVENVRKAGLAIERVEPLGMGDIFKMIVARRGEA